MKQAAGDFDWIKYVLDRQCVIIRVNEYHHIGRVVSVFQAPTEVYIHLEGYPEAVEFQLDQEVDIVEVVDTSKLDFVLKGY